eukprot:scaffold62601_cov28-Tisochrysis_lutea.AAC.5
MRSGPSNWASWISIRITEPMCGDAAAFMSASKVACSWSLSIGTVISCRSALSDHSAGSSEMGACPVAISARQLSSPSRAQAVSGSTTCAPPSMCSEESGARIPPARRQGKGIREHVNLVP